MISAAVVSAALALAPAQAGQAAPDPRLDWWREARFGMFIHWGLYAIPAGAWEGREVPGVGEWIMHTAGIPVEDYEPLAGRFNPQKFDARAIAALARRAGMKYLVITSKHHDGFCMFDSALTGYDVVDATPFKRDVIGEMAAACRAEGLRFGVYYSIMDWHHPDARGETFPRYVEHLRGQVSELIRNYDPDILWFDGEWIGEWTAEMGDDLYRLCRELKPAIIVNNRVGKGREGMSASRSSAGDFGTPEQEVPARGIPGYDWETCMTMNDSWGFKASDENWKPAGEIVRTLVDVASKGGNFLLNIGPTAGGEVPRESVERLEAVGEWMRTSGESIYGTRAGPFRRLSWGKCTAADGRLYLHVFDWPGPGSAEESDLIVPGLRNDILGAAPLSQRDTRLRTRREGDDVVIGFPPGVRRDPLVTVIRLDIAGDPDVAAAPLRPGSDGVLLLRAEDADLEGPNIRTQTQGGRIDIGYWTDPRARAAWEADLPAGVYAVEVELACRPENAGGQAVISAGGAVLRIVVPDTGSWSRFRTVDAGRLEIGDGGILRIQVAPGEGFTGALMNLRRVRLAPVE